MGKNFLDCPIKRVIKVIGGKWTIEILKELLEGEKRFGEMERALEGISPKTLSIRLKKLEDSGLVYRKVFTSIPPNVSYSLTDKGRALDGIFNEIREYGNRWLT